MLAPSRSANWCCTPCTYPAQFIAVEPAVGGWTNVQQALRGLFQAVTYLYDGTIEFPVTADGVSIVGNGTRSSPLRVCFLDAMGCDFGEEVEPGPDPGLGPGLFLPLIGGTLLGPLFLHADPVSPMQAVTKRYVDQQIAQGGTFVDAPADGEIYARQDHTWVLIPGIGSLDGGQY